MIPNKNKKSATSFWIRLTGHPSEFSMENRAFNYVSVVSFLLLFVFMLCDIYIRQWLMVGINVGLITTLLFLYYSSRVKKKYQVPVIIYAICSYLALGVNYYFNSGISGTTLCVFVLAFHLVIATVKPKQYPLWLSLQVGIALIFLGSEYWHPEWVQYAYKTRGEHFTDVATAYVVSILFIYAIINYLRKYYNYERKLAQEREKAILEQNDLITAQNKLLEKVNAEKDILFSIVSHDIKSPIDSVIGYLELLNNVNLDVVDRARLEADLLKQTKYTSEMLANLLSWAKAQMPGLKVNITSINVSDVISKVHNNNLTPANKKEIKILTNIDPSINILGDYDMVNIVLRNLLSNAIKFTRMPGTITLSCSIRDNQAVLSIRDTGVGIAKEQQDDIFSAKSKSTFGTNKEKGIGIGLKMCKQFVEFQNGNIWFESEPGKGSVFYVSLPLAS